MGSERWANDFPYWKTSKSDPGTWIGRCETEIERAGGRVIFQGEATDPSTDERAFSLAFDLAGDTFNVVWPVLPVESDNDRLASRRQAATMMYHDIKARCVTARVLGARNAFMSYLLVDGQPLSTRESANLPRLLLENTDA